MLFMRRRGWSSVMQRTFVCLHGRRWACGASVRFRWGCGALNYGTLNTWFAVRGAVPSSQACWKLATLIIVYEGNAPTVVALLDLTKAFNAVVQELTWKALKGAGMLEGWVQIMES